MDITESCYYVTAMLINCQTFIRVFKVWLRFCYHGLSLSMFCWNEKIATSSKSSVSRKFPLVRNNVNICHWGLLFCVQYFGKVSIKCEHLYSNMYVGTQTFLLENLWFTDVLCLSEGNFYVQFCKRILDRPYVGTWLSEAQKAAPACTTKLFSIFTCQYLMFPHWLWH